MRARHAVAAAAAVTGSLLLTVGCSSSNSSSGSASGTTGSETKWVLVDGKDMASVPAARRDMGMVFQSYSLFPNMSALDFQLV